MIGLVNTDDLLALREAVDDYDNAQLGRLNLTADALRAAAARCGYDWRKDGPVYAWAARKVGAYGLKRPQQ
jgi:hypothetical protein